MGFLKRDFLELRFINDLNKIQRFINESVAKTESNIMRSLFLYNKMYGVILKDKIIVPSKTGLYWRICVVDDSVNFASNIVLWGSYLAIVEITKGVEKVWSFSYCLPFLDEFFYCAESQGVFLNGKKLSLEGVERKITQTFQGSLKDVHCRILGSHVLHLCYAAANKLSLVCCDASQEFVAGLAHLFAIESRGQVFLKGDQVFFGSSASVELLKNCNKN